MNSTQEKGITWFLKNDEPTANVHISRDMSIEELHDFGRQVYSVLAEMQWSQATWLEAGLLGAGIRNMHLVRKSAYERDHSAAALCGRKPGRPWDVVHILAKSLQGGICKKCLAAMEGSEGGEHGSK